VITHGYGHGAVVIERGWTEPPGPDQGQS
jgi:hypothetical protein